MRSLYTSFLALLLTGGLAGCDFQAAEDAFNDFDVVIGLEPINTVVNGIIVDNATGELIAAELEFSGPGATVLIDAYSDPIDKLSAGDGVVTFGIENAVVPSVSAPVELTVTARAEGYFAKSESFDITETGDFQFTISLPSQDFQQASRGTALAQDASGSTDSGGAVTQTVTVQTQPTGQTTQTASVTVPQGTVPVTAAGTRLSGQITTQLKSYDSREGLQALPPAARQRSDGTNQAVGGAAFFKMSDTAGNVALTAQAASSGVVASKTAGVCNGGIGITLNNTDPNLRATYDAIVSAGFAVDAEIYAFTPADGQNNLVASTLVETDGAGLKVDLCLGGSAGSDGLINTSAIGIPDDGIIYTFSFASSLTTSGTLDRQITLSGLAGTKNVTFRLAGPGINRAGTVAVSNGSYKLSTLVATSSTLAAVTNASYALVASYAGSTETVSVTMDTPFTGSSSLALPATSDLQTYNITASLQCADPVNEKFEVQITSQSLDAVSAFYRIAGGGASWTVLSKRAITSKTATDARIEIKGTLDLKPSTQYHFRGVLGNDSSTTLDTTPASGGTWTIALSTSEVGIDCVAR